MDAWSRLDKGEAANGKGGTKVGKEGHRYQNIVYENKLL